MNLPTPTDALAYEDLLSNPPLGLVVKREGAAVVIETKRSCLAIGCFLALLTVWTTIMAVVMGSFVFLLLSATAWAPVGVGLFALALLGLDALFLYFVFARHTCRLDEETLTVERSFLGWRKRWWFNRKGIDSVGDRFYWRSEGRPVGYLFIHGEKEQRFPFPLYVEAVRWLGTLLSIWAGVDYIASSGFGLQGRPRQKGPGPR